MIKTVGSVCSGIEAASVAWKAFGVQFSWFSEIAPFPSRVLAEKYPAIPNLGDMKDLPEKITRREIEAPDLICGGTPCQAFSLAGRQNGLKDDRGNLTLRFVDIIDANDAVRLAAGKSRCSVFWENVEGVLTDKTNAFGCLVSFLAGFGEVLAVKGNKWPNAGLIRGKTRNVAWRVLDAKYFGLPQQRRRLYLIAGGKELCPENILFEAHRKSFEEYPSSELLFDKEGHEFEVFREYADCLYSAYGTKWNGNAAAYNGSLFVVQDRRLRRLSPLEAERLMGFPDNYTNLVGAKKTNRYQVAGNSWAVPVVSWIGKRLIVGSDERIALGEADFALADRIIRIQNDGVFYNLGKDVVLLGDGTTLNCTPVPENCAFASLKEIVSPDAPEDIYISPVGCYGILRRKMERNLKINPRLEAVLLSIASQMPPEEIEKKSRIQHRGRFSTPNESDREGAKEGSPGQSLIEKKAKEENGPAEASNNGLPPLPYEQLSMLDVCKS
ncbi:MAG: DNA cytosine methyltransferase [Clostridia bacterium]|nr:DNA cytosine methyltransferase [Clostridia bacterium]